MSTNGLERVVVFRVGDQLYAIDVMAVDRVIRHQTPRAVPLGSADIAGVLDVEGRLVPLVDLRARLLRATPVETPQTRVLLVTVSGDVLGFVVDQVLDVRATDAGMPEPPAALLNPGRPVFIGTLRRGKDLVLVVDAAALVRLTGEHLATEAIAAHS